MVHVVSYTRAVRTRVGVGAVIVIVVFALPPAAVTGGGVLMAVMSVIYKLEA